jgi:hypothetical protein
VQQCGCENIAPEKPDHTDAREKGARSAFHHLVFIIANFLK